MSLLATNTPARAPLPPPTPPAQPRPPSPSPTPPAPSSNAMQTPPFLTKLFQLVSDPATDELVSWTGSDGRAFTVHKPSEFGRDVLPKYFKHNNFSSFVRQLNQYGFHKQNPDKWMFGHDSFQRQLPNLLKNITRRRPKPQTGSSPASSQAVVAPSSLAQKAVVELGNYGIEGEVKSLKRDKDLLIKELVVTRQAEEKLKEKCDNLETRMESLEKTSGQMQSFIMHYFSQVLQPYSEAMASRKRKRIVSSSPSDMQDVLSDASNPPRAGAQPVSHQSTPTQSIDTLRVMMQQMQMNIARSPSQPHVRPPPPRQTPPLVEAPQSPTNAYAPATVQELPHEELSSGDLGRLSPLVAARLNGDAGNSMGDGSLGEDNSEDEGEGLLGFLQDMPSASDTSLTMDAIELALKEPNGTANGGTHLDTPDYVGKQFSETNGELCDPTTCKNEEKAIEDFLDLDPDQTPLPPPLTHLPNGTDVHALALEIQGFKEQRDAAAGSQ